MIDSISNNGLFSNDKITSVFEWFKSSKIELLFKIYILYEKILQNIISGKVDINILKSLAIKLK